MIGQINSNGMSVCLDAKSRTNVDGSDRCESTVKEEVVSQIIIVLSFDPDAIIVDERLMERQLTYRVCSARVLMQLP